MPRGRPPKVDHVREGFLYQIEVAENLESAVKPLMAIHPGAARSLHPKHVYRTIELAFMGVCAAWEDFLEATMVRYLAKAETDSGYEPLLRVGNCLSISHAFEVLSGKPGYDPEEQFMTWTNPVSVTKLAEVFFIKGAPFKTPLTRECNRLKQAVKIRNRVAHASEKCKTDFRKAANTVRQLQVDKPLGRGFSVGELLNLPAGAFFGAHIPAQNITIFAAYMEVFKQLAEDIVPTH
jgi:hypothetical protein